MPDDLEEEQPDPNDQIARIEAELHDLEAAFGAASQPDDEPADETPAPADQEPGEGDAQTDAPQHVSLLGRDFRPDEAQGLVDFYDWVRANPQQAVAIDAFMRGQAQFVVPQQAPPPPAPSTPSPELEEEDDLPASVKAKLAEIDDLKRMVEGVSTDSMARRHAEARATIDAVSAQMKERYNLGDGDLEELQRDAAALNIVPGLVQQGAPWGAAVEKAIDTAYWANPKYREAHAARVAQQQRNDESRQRKASSISGGSGSVPRQSKPANTPEERRAAIVDAIAASMNNGNAS